MPQSRSVFLQFIYIYQKITQLLPDGYRIIVCLLKKCVVSKHQFIQALPQIMQRLVTARFIYIHDSTPYSSRSEIMGEACKRGNLKPVTQGALLVNGGTV